MTTSPKRKKSKRAQFQKSSKGPTKQPKRGQNEKAKKEEENNSERNGVEKPNRKKDPDPNKHKAWEGIGKSTEWLKLDSPATHNLVMNMAEIRGPADEFNRDHLGAVVARVKANDGTGTPNAVKQKDVIKALQDNPGKYAGSHPDKTGWTTELDYVARIWHQWIEAGILDLIDQLQRNRNLEASKEDQYNHFYRWFRRMSQPNIDQNDGVGRGLLPASLGTTGAAHTDDVGGPIPQVPEFIAYPLFAAGQAQDPTTAPYNPTIPYSFPHIHNQALGAEVNDFGSPTAEGTYGQPEVVNAFQPGGWSQGYTIGVTCQL